MNITPEIAKAWAPLFFGILLIAVLMYSVTWYLKRKNMLVPVNSCPLGRQDIIGTSCSCPTPNGNQYGQVLQ